MKHLITLAILVMTVMSTGPSEAAERTVKLSVPGMNCASCPYMVKQAISWSTESRALRQRWMIVRRPWYLMTP